MTQLGLREAKDKVPLAGRSGTYCYEASDPMTQLGLREAKGKVPLTGTSGT